MDAVTVVATVDVTDTAAVSLRTAVAVTVAVLVAVTDAASERAAVAVTDAVVVEVTAAARRVAYSGSRMMIGGCGCPRPRRATQITTPTRA